MTTDKMEKQQVVETLTSDPLIGKAQEKLSRKFLDVEIPRELSLLDSMEMSLALEKKRIAESDGNTPKEIADGIVDAEQQIEALRKNCIVGTLVPLKAVETLMVRGFVTEAGLQAQSMGFDLDVQLLLMAQAEVMGMAFLALRKRNAQSERYFATQELVTQMDDKTLQYLGRIYRDNFVLTEDERKNI